MVYVAVGVDEEGISPSSELCKVVVLSDLGKVQTRHMERLEIAQETRMMC